MIWIWTLFHTSCHGCMRTLRNCNKQNPLDLSFPSIYNGCIDVFGYGPYADSPSVAGTFSLHFSPSSVTSKIPTVISPSSHDSLTLGIGMIGFFKSLPPFFFTRALRVVRSLWQDCTPRERGLWCLYTTRRTRIID